MGKLLDSPLLPPLVHPPSPLSTYPVVILPPGVAMVGGLVHPLRLGAPITHRSLLAPHPFSPTSPCSAFHVPYFITSLQPKSLLNSKLIQRLRMVRFQLHLWRGLSLSSILFHPPTAGRVRSIVAVETEPPAYLQVRVIRSAVAQLAKKPFKRWM